MTRKHVLFLALFSLLGFIALQIPFTKLMGSNVSFTLFDFFGPIAGAFLGPVYGVVSVLLVELLNIAIKQTPLTAGPIIRLFPMLFAVWYFGTVGSTKSKGNLAGKDRWILAVSLLAIIIFIAHPIGRAVWYYSLFWTIPLIAYVRKDWLLARSLGATFTAHAVGGAAWIWAFNLPASVWNSLIPIVIEERLVMALGISGSYLLMKYIVSYLVGKKLLPSLPAFQSTF